jgi:hypothetical protein
VPASRGSSPRRARCLHREAQGAALRHRRRLGVLEGASTVGPWYQGCAVLRSMTLSPSRALTGMAMTRDLQARRRTGDRCRPARRTGVLEADGVELVDAMITWLDAHERADREVPERLALARRARRRPEDGDVGVGRRDRHVAGVLLVTRGVGDDHAPAVGQQHVPVGHVDRDALLALGLEAVGEQREVDLADGDRRAGATHGARHVAAGRRAPSRSRRAAAR